MHATCEDARGWGAGVSFQMKDAKVSDFVGYHERAILRHSRLFYIARLSGFVVSVVVPLGIMVWSISTNHAKQGVIAISVLVPVGYIGFVVSLHAASYCKLCGRRLEKFWSEEQRGSTRYTGRIVVCAACKAFEARLSAEFDN